MLENIGIKKSKYLPLPGVNVIKLFSFVTDDEA